MTPSILAAVTPCANRPPKCPGCGKGFLHLDPDSEHYVCSNKNCEFTAKKCPICGGYLITRSGTPDFYGCSNYFSLDCRYTEPLRLDKQKDENQNDSIQSNIDNKPNNYKKAFFTHLKTKKYENLISATELLTTYGFSYDQSKEIIEEWIKNGEIEKMGQYFVRIKTSHNVGS